MSDPRIAIGLTTCDRPQYTELTLLSLAKHNDLSRFVLLQADDASQDSRNRDMGKAMGFELVHAPAERQGHMAGIRALVREAINRGCDYMLILENDYETVRPFPWDAFAFASFWQSLRLFGAMKMREGPRAKAATGLIGTDREIQWRSTGQGYELAPEAHWTPNSVTRTDLLAAHARLPRVKDVCKAFHPKTLRVVHNVVWHIGEEQTEGFKP